MAVERPRAQKIDRDVMHQMIDAGKSHTEVGAFFGASKQAVQKALTIDRQEDAVRDEIEQHWDEIADADEIGVLSQLRILNDSIMREFDRCKGLIDREYNKLEEYHGLEDALKLDPANKELKKQIDAHTANKSVILKIQSSLIEVSSEIRRIMESGVKYAEAIYSSAMMSQFQNEVLSAIAKVDPTTRDAIIKELKRVKTVRGLVQIKK